MSQLCSIKLGFLRRESDRYQEDAYGEVSESQCLENSLINSALALTNEIRIKNGLES